MEPLHEYISELQTLFKAGARATYSKGETVIRPENTPQGVFLITEGYVKSYDITKYGEENLLVIRRKNQIFPLLWTMTGKRTEVYYQALSDVVVYRIDRESYLKKLNEDPKFTRAVLDQVLYMYEMHSQRVLNLEYRTAPERIAFRLVMLADRFGNKIKEGVEIALPIRHHDIADSVNCSRETVSRELTKLQKRGFVKSVNGSLVITDIHRLMDFVDVQESIRNRFG